MKRTFALVFVLVFLFSFSAVMAQKAPQVVTMTCVAGDTVDIANPHARIYPGETVTFRMNTTGVGVCSTGVNVNGATPIGNFDLTLGDPAEVITFPDTGMYEYDVTELAGPRGITHGKVEVRTEFGPTLTEWGIIALVVLILGSAAFIMLRRKKASVPA